MVEIQEITQYLVGGHYFNDYEEALEFKKELEEKEAAKVIMYNSTGHITEKASSAAFVELRGVRAAELFIEQCEAENTQHEGIDEEYEGFFVWSLDEDKYIYLSPDDIRAIKTIFKDKG